MLTAAYLLALLERSCKRLAHEGTDEFSRLSVPVVVVAADSAGLDKEHKQLEWSRIHVTPYTIVLGVTISGSFSCISTPLGCSNLCTSPL